MHHRWLWALGLAACAGRDDGETDGDPALDTSVGSTGTLGPPAGLGLLHRLTGLWTGPARDTPLGVFPLMNVDFRAADDRTLWGRVDVDPDNALRFALAVEDHDGPTLVYRNGDDRTVLVEADEDAACYRFCHLDQGCDVRVRRRGGPHVRRGHPTSPGMRGAQSSEPPRRHVARPVVERVGGDLSAHLA